ncbi:uncharacterized protein BJ212DRAFT_1569381 [Suillus subaureus]|uniref:Sld7 C-terminal domain-containing protein n=1 Tax=Suillus subaureus TaxID=48587 RepID=A0A9P7E7B5_9AGAM|nr:uncharacterized protein BJ212DRAFT_1569381 [Suillus subaureus]KAG1813135.1 hypothetical protein BJ212DRAFT_1569381 [Suillus subaureus]
MSEASSSRLLYRGSLSLPDSYILLDGLTFSANLLANKDLLHNPLALALESMRGRPSLRLKGTESLKNICIDPSDDVCMDIHPSATLSRVYFENMLCLSHLSPDGRTEMGARVALGDTDGPATTEILIFGKAHSSPTTPSITIRVARITPATRAPRPDDPTPRKPPQHLLTRTQSIGELAANTRIKVKGDESEVVRRAREVMLHLPNSKSRGRGKDKERGSAVFKVPTLPAKKTNHAPEADVFGPLSDAKGKARAVDDGVGDIEQENKSIIKKFTVRHLDAVGVSKAHPEFKELFGFVYRGTTFALRATIKKSSVSALALETLVEAHIKLYVTSPI